MTVATQPTPSASWWLSPALRSDGTSVDQPVAGERVWWRKRWAVALAFVLVFVVGTVAVGGVARAVGADTALANSLGTAGGAVVGYLVVLWLEARGAIELSGRRWVGLLGGLVLGALLVSACIGLVTAFGFREFTGSDPGAAIWTTVLQIGVAAGIFEEIVFRGILMRFVEGWLGTWGATIASGLFFGLAHISNPNSSLWAAFAIAIEAGVLFGLLYALTRSLWMVIGLHAAWNIVQGPVFGVQVSGTESPSLLLSHPVGNTLLSGGTFGIEASLVTVMLLSAVSAVLAWQLVKRHLVVAPAWVRQRALTSPAASTADGRDATTG